MNFNDIVDKDTADYYLLDLHRQALVNNMEMSIWFLNEALAKLNLMLNRKNLRSAMTQDEEIDTGLQRSAVEKMIADLEQLKSTV
jgi:hypothetical protein